MLVQEEGGGDMSSAYDTHRIASTSSPTKLLTSWYNGMAWHGKVRYARYGTVRYGMVRSVVVEGDKGGRDDGTFSPRHPHRGQSLPGPHHLPESQTKIGLD